MTDTQFVKLAKQYTDTVYRLAFSYMKNREDAQDVTQDVLLALYQSDKPFASEEHVRHWLLRVTANRCRSSLRAAWRKTVDIADYAELLTEEEREEQDLFRTVMSLPVKYRTVLHLFYYEDMTTAQIAGTLALPESTVRTRLARGREQMKKIMAEESAV